MKDHELRLVQERLEALAERVSEIGQAQDQSDDTVATLATALSDLVGRMRKQDRIITLNSFVAYALFTVLLGAAFLMLHRSRAGDLERERDQAQHALVAAEERAGHATRELAAREAAEKGAAEIYEMACSAPTSAAGPPASRSPPPIAASSRPASCRAASGCSSCATTTRSSS